ncbi:Type I restriction-modification system, specificity subunit S [Moraxella catarrhalis]|uniref:restriction endonuclease subunit S n=1 Tax=Moraxella catarrhalis TaxID=480 RepID=UPI0007E38989|nr:restriction endonuclease subunit S [Moraxella catarrhalis]OAV11223.1 Type I restriction-modification system, specificity subunit S [Moraxella catarrhalis]OAV13669.1 Type I restriction-modification system, specificity subunit S [Moraxella catarrhalis]
MNVMIKKLLQGQAVEWRALGEVLVRTKGTKITAGKMKELHKNNAPIKIFAGGKTFALVDFDDIPQKDINHKPSIIVKSRGIIEFEYYDKPFSHKNEMWAYHSQNPNINIKFIYYFLKQNEPYFQKIGSKMQMPQIATPDTDKFKIPIPPLSVQAKIVQILDTFTELNGQLTAEFGMRQKQYQYYRDFLLSEHELAKVGFEWKTLGEVANYEQPTKYLVKSKDYDDDFKTPVLTAGKTFILGYTNETNGIYQASKNPVIIFDDFTTANKWVDFDFKAKSSAMKMISSVDENQFLLKYIYYWLNTLPSGLVDGDHKRQWISNFANKKIPIPPLSVQSQIVAILDTFDTLTQSISEGLPKEIKLRQKQYEYYRERLLNFKATI